MATHPRTAFDAVQAIVSQHASFTQIKQAAGAAGLPLDKLAHLVQTSGNFKSASKGQLIDAVSGLLPDDERACERAVDLFLRSFAGDRAVVVAALDASMQPHGWAFDGTLHRIGAPATIDVKLDAHARWDAVGERLAELASRLESARSLDDFQDVGRRSREIVADAAELVFSDEHVPAGEEVPNPRDAKRVIDNYVAAHRADMREELRKVVRDALALMNAATHSGTATLLDAVSAAQSAILIVRVVQTVEAT
jgi:hypothetical protein